MIRRYNINLFKAACIIYHKDILKIFKPEWILKCLDSIERQTSQNFTLLELNYGNDSKTLEEILNYEIKIPKKKFYHKPLKNHVWAMNYLLDKAFKELDFDVVFNTNGDDFYNLNRFQCELQAIAAGYELISTEFEYIKDIEGFDKKLNSLRFGNCDIKKELEKGNNVLCHPSICYSRVFWEKYGPYEDVIPFEDLLLWQKAALQNSKIYIIPEVLTYYRLHSNQISGITRTWTP